MRFRQSRGAGVCLYINNILSYAVGMSTADVIAGSVSRLQSIHPGARVIIVGDFNLCTLDGVLSSFQQIVTCPTKQSTCAIVQWMKHTPRNVSLPWGGQIKTSYISCPSTVKNSNVFYLSKDRSWYGLDMQLNSRKVAMPAKIGMSYLGTLVT